MGLASLISITDDRSQVQLAIGPVSSPICEEDILTQLRNLNCFTYFQFGHEIKRAVSSINKLEPDSKVMGAVVIAERRDATLVIKAEQGGMQASVTVIGACGGAHISFQQLLIALKSNGIVRGITRRLAERFVKDAQQLFPGEKHTQLIAKGKLPIDGEDAKFVPSVLDLKERILRPKALENGKVDMRDLGAIATVTEGTELMRRYPPTDGVPGYKVTGDVLEAKPGQMKAFQIFAGSEIDAKDENRLISTRSGLPVIKDKGVEVEEALVLKNVDISTGHLHFEGSILVSGDIQPGMKVTASGSVSVGGFVESAEIKAQGHVIIGKGVIGRLNKDEQTYSCEIESGGEIAGVFAQYTKMSAQGNIHFTSQVLHCDIHTRGKVIVSDQNRRNGTLSGGQITSFLGVDVINLGSASGTETLLICGEQIAALRVQSQQLQSQLDESHQKFMQVKQAAKKLLLLQRDQRPDEMVNKLKQSHLLLSEQSNILRLELGQVREAMDASFKSVMIYVRNRLYPGVNVGFDQDELRITQERSPSIIHYHGQKVMLSPLLSSQ
ncbi:hypothetical protein VST7929_03289 [Vibrio stylophorae]|uniref:Flagellar Assembly Protein A N-terminal region domain-containing protein n=1 Tax=Vibrio stylophorae TaxID=659351 RepID=A0ABN8DWR8_9VIBR|nr:FapA family protein [Vibrio stylophorae]CAH0535815.1 hypothetical protein VST7929_03289 [Vibrio stylophorae]